MKIQKEPTLQIADEQGIGVSYEGAKVAADYVGVRFESATMGLLHGKQLETINQMIKRTTPNRILELAPGPGRLTRGVKTQAELTCLELNHGMIEEGKRHTRTDIRWIQGSAFQLPFDEPLFDLVYTFRFIRHFKKVDRQRLYEQVRNVIASQGLFIFDAVNAIVSAPLRKASPECYPIYDKLYESQQHLIDELGESGFETVELRPVLSNFHLQRKIQWLVGPRSEILCKYLVQGVESLNIGQPLEWIVICRPA